MRRISRPARAITIAIGLPSFPAAHGGYSTAEARVWAGIHFRFDIEAGEEIGRKVGERVLARAFAPKTN